ncbi:hypothetical protein J2S00_001700 [Caldalkalibacillus uzonensis]|uniref:Uncharacterized protein n=1 Tax=Caldalkalibacillus uzonensis TaxID=353224 RepID=A0ABU0CSS9_9BACI|nr:hypothetical protein [Caldalkalibacillus uzonensis]
MNFVFIVNNMGKHDLYYKNVVEKSSGI